LPAGFTFVRVGYVTNRTAIKRKGALREIPMLCVGYAPQHSLDNYQMYNPLKDSVVTSRDIRWTNWVQSDPTVILQKLQIAEETVIQSPQAIRNREEPPSANRRQFNSHLIPPDDEDDFDDGVDAGRNGGENPQQEEEIKTTSQRRDTGNNSTLPEQTKIQTRSQQRNKESNIDSGSTTYPRTERVLRNLNSEINYDKNVPDMIEDDEDTSQPSDRNHCNVNTAIGSRGTENS
jgi:hypothetical protein